MENTLVAEASVDIAAPVSKVWNALIDPELIKSYMFGATVISDWRQGSPIVWKGEWNGRAYEDKGTILRIDPERALAYSHFSPLSGLADAPENYHTVTMELSARNDVTRLRLSQDNNPTDEARRHSETNWRMMLDGLKKFVESSGS